MKSCLPILLLLAACSVGGGGAPAPDSPSARLAARAGEVETDARQIEELARELESQTDRLREQVKAGENSQEEAVAELQERMQRLAQLNAALQEKVAAIELEARTTAGMAPPEPLDDRPRR